MSSDQLDTLADPTATTLATQEAEKQETDATGADVSPEVLPIQPEPGTDDKTLDESAMALGIATQIMAFLNTVATISEFQSQLGQPAFDQNIEATETQETSTPTEAVDATATSSTQTEPTPASEEPTPSAVPTSEVAAQAAPATPAQIVASLVVPASAQASSAAPCSRDSQSNPVCYTAENLIDGILTTAWRDTLSNKPTLSLELSETMVITKIGFVSGYDKVDAFDGVDRWHQNYRPRRISIALDGVEDDVYKLTDTREWQAIDLLPRPTRRIELTILDGYAPLEGNRPYVAISEIVFLGYWP